jgi:hypothetical protein
MQLFLYVYKNRKIMTVMPITVFIETSAEDEKSLVWFPVGRYPVSTVFRLAIPKDEENDCGIDRQTDAVGKDYAHARYPEAIPDPPDLAKDKNGKHEEAHILAGTTPHQTDRLGKTGESHGNSHNTHPDFYKIGHGATFGISSLTFAGYGVLETCLSGNYRVKVRNTVSGEKMFFIKKGPAPSPEHRPQFPARCRCIRSYLIRSIFRAFVKPSACRR